MARVVRTFLGIPTRDVQEIDPIHFTMHQALKLRDEWRRGWRILHPRNYRVPGYRSPWKEPKN
jgi:hypothetical protein